MRDYSKAKKTELIEELRALESARPSVDDLQRLLHELQVHQVELEIQNRELRETQQLLEQSRDEYADLYDFAPLGYATLDRHGVIHKINLTGATLLGKPSMQCIGAPFNVFVHANDRQRFRLHLQQCLQDTDAAIELELTDREQPTTVRLNSMALARGAQDVSFRIAMTDISAHKRAQEELRRAQTVLEHLAHYDILTDLPNRALLRDRITQALSAARRSHSRLAVLFLDMDLFKIVNDSLGHATGDEILKSVAQRILQCLRAGDTVSRHGGDEFVILLPELDSDGDVVPAVEKILQAVCQPYLIGKHELNVTASIGISLYPRDGDDFESLIKHADIAMYHAKDNGRNNYRFFTPDLSVDISRRQALENSLHRAIERDEFVLYYQPQVATHSGAVVGCEALIRWRHPEQGLVLPDRFIPIAEQCGLINSIGEWVLRSACAQYRQWLQQGWTPIPIAVNISGLQLRQKKFGDIVAEILREHDVHPRHLELELTEGTLLQHVDTTVDCLRRLKHIGLRTVLDDFGTGYSSLGYLKRFPIDKLKIDRSFVCDLPDSKEDATLVRTIISMGHNLGLSVIAEGVETPAQRAFLAAEQCDEMQGYFFSPPLPAEEFARLLQNRPPAR